MNLYNLFCLVTAVCTVKGGKQRSIVFPDERDEYPTSHVTKEVPLTLAKRMNDFDDVTNLVDELFPQEVSIISARFGAGPERKALRLAKLAVCQPENQIIPLTSPDDASFYIPSCTRVKRCSGCCSHHLLSCQPVESEILQLGVVVSQYFGGDRLTKRRREIVSVEQHTKCKCDCKVKEADCNPYQRYSADSCQCVCNNADKEAKCAEEASEKLWDATECACVCREFKECSTGQYYDRYTCKCVEGRQRRTNVTKTDFERFNYRMDLH